MLYSSQGNTESRQEGRDSPILSALSSVLGASMSEQIKTVTPMVAVDPLAAICNELSITPKRAEKHLPCPAELTMRAGKFVLEVEPSALAAFLHPMKEKAKLNKDGNEVTLSDGTIAMERPNGRTCYLASKPISVNGRELTINANAFLR